MKIWRILGYLLVVLSVFLVIIALFRVTHLPSTTDTARHLGGIVGSFFQPIATGFLARYCFRRARHNRS
jgi:hypothetical protein